MATAAGPVSDVEEMQTGGGGWKVTVLNQQLSWGASPRKV